MMSNFRCKGSNYILNKRKKGGNVLLSYTELSFLNLFVS